MRTGLFGIAGTTSVPSISDALVVSGSGRHAAFGVDRPVHVVQRSVLREHQGKVYGAHGVWLNGPSWEWDTESCHEALAKCVSAPEEFDVVEGPLQGFMWDNEAQTLRLHADFARQHPLFWTPMGDGVAFAYSVDKLVELMKGHGVEVVPDEEGAALLLTYGSILGDGTLVRGVRKLMPGHSLHWSPEGVQASERKPLAQIEKDVHSMADAVELLDRAFNAVTQAMVDCNLHAGCTQHHLLSGGLDSRVVAMAASEVGQAGKVSSLCFSAQGSRDESISASIARQRGWTHTQVDLGHGAYLCTTDSWKEYDGCVNYLASAHHRWALGKASLDKLGLLGSGQGANVLLTDRHKWELSGSALLRGMTLYQGVRTQAESVALQAWAQVQDPQVFKVVNRGFLYTNSGAYSTGEFGVLWSPFTSREFVRSALRLSRDLVKDQKAYLTWMAERHPEATKHPWERYGVRPLLGWRLRLAQAWALTLARIRRWIPLASHGGMSPIQQWHDASPEIQDFYTESFATLRSTLRHFPNVGPQVERDFESMSVMNKASVLTLLLASQTWFDA